MISTGYLLLFASILILTYILISSIRSLKRTSIAGQSENLLKLDKYEDSFIFMTSQELKNKQQFFIIISLLFTIPVIFLGFFQWIICALIFGIGGYSIPLIGLNIQLKKRYKKFDNQTQDFIETVSNSLKAGLSFIQALENAANQLEAPLSQELKLTLKENSLGVNIDDALIKMSKKMQSKNFTLVVSAITITRQLGGNLPAIFSTISETIRERSSMEGKISALTAQGKIQAIMMSAMPFCLMIGIYFIDRKTIMPLFNTTIGVLLLVLMIVLNTIGYFFINKIVNIET